MSASATMRLKRLSSANVEGGQVDLVERVAAELDDEANGLGGRGSTRRACGHTVPRSHTENSEAAGCGEWQSERVLAKGRLGVADAPWEVGGNGTSPCFHAHPIEVPLYSSMWHGVPPRESGDERQQEIHHF
jgi:hypothetical protein